MATKDTSCVCRARILAPLENPRRRRGFSKSPRRPHGCGDTGAVV